MSLLQAVTAGSNPIVLKKGIDKTCDYLVGKLKEVARPVKGTDDIRVCLHLSAPCTHWHVPWISRLVAVQLPMLPFRATSRSLWTLNSCCSFKLVLSQSVRKALRYCPERRGSCFVQCMMHAVVPAECGHYLSRQ